MHVYSKKKTTTKNVYIYIYVVRLALGYTSIQPGRQRATKARQLLATTSITAPGEH